MYRFYFDMKIIYNKKEAKQDRVERAITNVLGTTNGIRRKKQFDTDMINFFLKIQLGIRGYALTSNV